MRFYLKHIQTVENQYIQFNKHLLSCYYVLGILLGLVKLVNQYQYKKSCERLGHLWHFHQCFEDICYAICG